ncbi:uncharacterized protein Z520_09211 [Fonsecaea multimorphosa CBS 102226]|uniref:Uncharacterized protein n=1 Tax=Fonsecaea multimorphosa CBS 102226 TaxID=1442371 RepID=A0A0D2ICP5_9EURO|nr:uncharacterized protein Z520_09211 [Fonsecaea multimorphosa CBS 102226]KIX94901.1 hypothetical protein Z520_09211 [Fonsecaea multimorphosa CBS 102226]OAL20553.1 hypothetical protein AYO22_08562 [Fonsecaea multimorphosa]
MSSVTADHTIVLITGANQGIGFECVKKLAAEQANYHILLGSRSLERGKEAASSITDLARGTAVEALELDVDDDESIAKAAKYVEEKFGRLDVLLNNAGISQVKDVSFRENMTRVLQTNTISAACVTEAFIPLMRKAPVPRLLFMSSGLGSVTLTLDPSFQYYGLGNATAIKGYIVSKCAENMVGALYAVQLGKEGFKVNMTCPGHRATNLNGYNEHAGPAADGAIEACRLIVDTDKNGQHATFTTSPEKQYPW